MKRGIKTVLIWGLLLGVVFFALLSRNRDDGEPPVYVATEQSLEMIDAGRICAYRVRKDHLRPSGTSQRL